MGCHSLSSSHSRCLLTFIERSHNCGLPMKHVISNWTCRTLCWRVTGQITKFLINPFQRHSLCFSPGSSLSRGVLKGPAKILDYPGGGEGLSLLLTPALPDTGAEGRGLPRAAASASSPRGSWCLPGPTGLTRTAQPQDVRSDGTTASCHAPPLPPPIHRRVSVRQRRRRERGASRGVQGGAVCFPRSGRVDVPPACRLPVGTAPSR